MSMPFGTSSLETSKIGVLSVEQTLADYAFFLTDFKKTFNAENCPIIAFGISYDRLLSAFMRFKYPNIIQGSIASSAPLFMLENLTTGYLYYQTMTEVKL